MSKYNKTIQSMAGALKEIKAHGLACSGGTCHIDNNFQTKVARNIIDKLFDDGKLQIAPTVGQWFEEGYKLKECSMKNNAATIKIHFEDQGQDLLWWVIDLETCRVTDCGPFHKGLYVGKYVFLPRYIKTGHLVHYSDTQITTVDQPLQIIRFKITEVESL